MLQTKLITMVIQGNETKNRIQMLKKHVHARVLYLEQINTNKNTQRNKKNYTKHQLHWLYFCSVQHEQTAEQKK